MTATMVHQAAVHTHHWRIDEPEPGKRHSQGVCFDCGAIRDFDNWAVEDRGYTWSEAQQRRRRAEPAKR